MDLACFGFLKDIDICNKKYPYISRWKRMITVICDRKNPDSTTINFENDDRLQKTDPPIDICAQTGEVRVIQNESDYLLDTSNQVIVGDLNITPGNLGKRKKRKLQSEEEKDSLLTTRRD